METNVYIESQKDWTFETFSTEVLESKPNVEEADRNDVVLHPKYA